MNDISHQRAQEIRELVDWFWLGLIGVGILVTIFGPTLIGTTIMVASTTAFFVFEIALWAQQYI